MIRLLLRLVVLVIVVGAIAVFLFGYRLSDLGIYRAERGAVATSGRTPQIDTSRARDAGAAIGEKVAAGANEAKNAIADAGIVGKIKSKMALDDTVKAADIRVEYSGGVVTLSGTVHSKAEHTRAVQLARETQGVTSVIDRLTIR